MRHVLCVFDDLTRRIDPWLSREAAAQRIDALDESIYRNVRSATLEERAAVRSELAPALALPGAAEFAPRALAWAERAPHRDPVGPAEALPVHPHLENCPSDLCPQLRAALAKAAELSPEALAWLEWLVRRVEIVGVQAGNVANTGDTLFEVGDAINILARAWLRRRDLRFVNCLLRKGDLLLRTGPRGTLRIRAAILAACAVREAALRELGA